MTTHDPLVDGALRVLFLAPCEPDLRNRLMAIAGRPGSHRRPPWRNLVLAGSGIALAALLLAVVLCTDGDGTAFTRRSADCVQIVSRSGAPEHLRVGAITLRVDGSARLEFAPLPPDSENLPMTRDQLRSFLAARAAVPVFTLAVLSGSATVEAQERHVVRAGETREVRQPTPTSPQDLAKVRELWAATLLTTDGVDSADEQSLELAFRLRRQPALFGEVRADLVRRVADPATTDEVFDRLVRLLCLDPDAGSLAIATRMLTGSRPIQDPEAWLCLSERGVAAARTRLAAYVAEQEPDSGEVFAAAAHLAATQDPARPIDVEHLRHILRAAFDHENGLEVPVLLRAMVAAHGLHALGDARPLATLWRDLKSTVEEQLGIPYLADAARMVAIADWVSNHGIDGKRGSLAWLDDGFLVPWSQEQFEQQLDSAAKIRARLAVIQPK
ncbi:MAG: hypothetical protein JNK15_24980 [Planctomycetes bacterium]|nr:hypothetical protein [Planctomycetota bacterium]